MATGLPTCPDATSFLKKTVDLSRRPSDNFNTYALFHRPNVVEIGLSTTKEIRSWEEEDTTKLFRTIKRMKMQ